MKLWQRSEQRRVQRFYHGSEDMYAGVRPRADLPPGTDLLPQIQHVVVLMMENHSFDNYFGLLSRGDGLPDGSASNTRTDGTPVQSFHFPDTRQCPRAPTQSWHASHISYDDGRNDGFVRSVEQTIAGSTAEQATLPMGYWTDIDLPFYAGLARTFPLADRWFSSCLGPTFPNRRFLIAGTAHGLIDDLPFGLVDYPEAGTVFDLLTRNGLSWINYHDVSTTRLIATHALGQTGLTLFRRLGLGVGKLFPTLLTSAVSNLHFTADLYPLGLASSLGHLRSLQGFFRDAKQGTLPQFSIVDPNFSKYSEENPQDIRVGEGFAAAVIDSVMHGPGWPKTLLIWTYDEHGGYYDHVSPPAARPPDDIIGRSLLEFPGWVKALLRPIFRERLTQLEAIDGDSDRKYDRYGFRVPAVIVSPYARPGSVLHDDLDHTSILKLLQEKWNLPALTRRDAAARSPLSALAFDNPAFLQPPDLPRPAIPWQA